MRSYREGPNQQWRVRRGLRSERERVPGCKLYMKCRKIARSVWKEERAGIGGHLSTGWGGRTGWGGTAQAATVVMEWDSRFGAFLCCNGTEKWEEFSMPRRGSVGAEWTHFGAEERGELGQIKAMICESALHFRGRRVS